MSDDNEMMLAFRALSGEWADRARAEARVAVTAFNQGASGATAAVRRLIAVVDHIRDTGNQMLDQIQAMLARLETSDELPDIEPDYVLQLGELAEEIVALQSEMSDLIRATSAVLNRPRSGYARDFAKDFPP